MIGGDHHHFLEGLAAAGRVYGNRQRLFADPTLTENFRQDAGKGAHGKIQCNLQQLQGFFAAAPCARKTAGLNQAGVQRQVFQQATDRSGHQAGRHKTAGMAVGQRGDACADTKCAGRGHVGHQADYASTHDAATTLAVVDRLFRCAAAALGQGADAGFAGRALGMQYGMFEQARRAIAVACASVLSSEPV